MVLKSTSSSVVGILLILFLTESVDSLGKDGKMIFGYPDQNLAERDVVLKSKQLDRDEFRHKRQIEKNTKQWKASKVFYNFDPNFAEHDRDIVRMAMRYIRARTCINFYEDSTATNLIQIVKGDGCSSMAGMVSGVQILSLGEGCGYVSTVTHELLHALGIVHMHMRDDRDNYVEVRLSSVKVNDTSQFKKLDASDAIKYTPYEYGSIMHYEANAFVREEKKDEITIMPKKRRYLWTLGSPIPSLYDMIMVNKYYDCSAKCDYYAKTACENGGVPNPHNCDECICPHGYGGTYCEERPSGCGETLEASPEWETKKFTIDQHVADGFEHSICNHWITAPSGKWIEIRIIELPSRICGYGCKRAAVEPKVLADKRMTNPRYCCDEQLNETLTSKLNPTPIFSYSQDPSVEFSFQYRYRDDFSH